MKIAIIGSGNVGGALAQRVLQTQHDLAVGVKFPLSEKSNRLAATIGDEYLCSVEDACQQAEIIIITTPPNAILEILPQMGNVANKIIVDATNAVRVKPEGFDTAYHAIKAVLKTDHVVKCFNTTGFENMLQPQYKDEGIDLFCAGNEVSAKQAIMQLTSEMGFGNCYDFGNDDKVVLLEQFALSWINLAIMQGMGRNIAFKLISR